MRRNEAHHEFGSAHGPRDSQGPSDIPPGHPHRWFGFGAISAFFFWPAAGHAHPGAKTRDFHAQGGCMGSMGPERCGSGVPNGPLGWSQSRFGRGRYLNSDPPFGHPEGGLWGRFGCGAQGNSLPLSPTDAFLGEYRIRTDRAARLCWRPPAGARHAHGNCLM